MTTTTMSLDETALVNLYRPFQPSSVTGWGYYNGYMGTYFVSQGSEYVLGQPHTSVSTEVPSADLVTSIVSLTSLIAEAAGDDPTYASLVKTLNTWSSQIQAGGTAQIMTVTTTAVHIRNNAGDDKADLTYTYVLCPVDDTQSLALLVQHSFNIDWAGTTGSIVGNTLYFGNNLAEYGSVVESALKVAGLAAEAVPGLDVIAALGLACTVVIDSYKYILAEGDDGGRLNFMGVIAHTLVRISSCVSPHSTARSQVPCIQASSLQAAWYNTSEDASLSSMHGVSTPYQAGVYFGTYPANQVMFASQEYDVLYNQPYVINMPEQSWPLGALPLTFATVKLFSNSKFTSKAPDDEEVYVLVSIIYGPGGNAVMAAAQCTVGPPNGLPAPAGTRWLTSDDKGNVNSEFAGAVFDLVEGMDLYTQATRQLYYVVAPLAGAICNAMAMTAGIGAQPSTSFRLSCGSPSQYDQGNAPSVAVRPDGIVVSSFDYSSNALLDPNISELRANCGRLSVSSGTVSWPNPNSGEKYDSGSWPTITTNPNGNGDILEFHNGGSNDIYWEYATVDTSNTTAQFSGSGKEGPNDGDHPGVYLGGDAEMIVIYAPGNNNLAYNIGTFSGSTVSCSDWSVVNYSAGNPAATVPGDYPTITRNGSAILEAHNESGQIWYNVGTFSADEKSISWQPGPFPLLQNGSHPHLAYLGGGRILLTYDNNGKIYVAAGTLSSNGDLQWIVTNLYVCDGHYPAIAYAPSHSPGDTVVMAYNKSGGINSDLYSCVCAVMSTVGTALGDTMTAGQSLGPDQSIRSANGQYQLIMQGDGNLVLYNAENVAMWASGTAGKPVTMCIMQDDGNLVVYGGATSTWASNTQGHSGSYLVVEDDGDIVIYDQDGTAIWSKGAA